MDFNDAVLEVGTSFRIGAFSFMSFLDLYLCWSLGFSTTGAALLTSALLIVLWVPLVFWERDREGASSFDLFMQWLAFTLMAWLTFLWVGTMVRDVISLFWEYPLRTWKQTEDLLVIATTALVLGISNAFFGVKIRELEIPIENLPKEHEGLRIVQISDLHIGPTIGKWMFGRVIRMIQKAKPDLLVLTGDAVDGTVGDQSHILEPFRSLETKYGKFYVPGNHEYYWGGAQWIAKFRELGFQVLTNTHVTVPVGDARLMLSGVTDPSATEVGGEGPNLQKSMRMDEGERGAYPHLLLAHRPDIAADAAAAGFQLQLSGHTHGGQFFPWTFVASWSHRYSHGLHRVGKMWIYVSRGTGYWGPPVRLGAPAEVGVLILRSA